MATKSTGGIIAMLFVIAIAAFIKIQNWQRVSRARETVNAEKVVFRQEEKKSNDLDFQCIQKFITYLRHGDLESAYNLTTNPPPGVSKVLVAELGKYTGVYGRFVKVNENIESRSKDECLDLDYMLEPDFYTGHNGYAKTIGRLDISIAFIDEIEAKIADFMAELKAVNSNSKSKVLFNLDEQWAKMLSSMNDSFSIMRNIAKSLKYIVQLHNEYQKAWVWEDDDVLYYDPDMCEKVNAERVKIAEYAQMYLEAQNRMSAAQTEGFDKLDSGFQCLKK